MEVTQWHRKSLLGLEELSAAEIGCILRQATQFKEDVPNPERKTDHLRGKRIVNLFLEPSTRTRIAFEIAAKSLSADVISITGKSSSLTKGETLRDTAMNVQALGADAIVVRHSSAGSSLFLSRTIDTQAKHCSTCSLFKKT